jgi:uncharacterized protein (DUF427 family)
MESRDSAPHLAATVATADTQAHGQVRVEASQKRVRAYLGGGLVVDTLKPLLVWERPFYPSYYLPLADVQAKLVPTGATEHSPSRGNAQVNDVVVGEAVAQSAALRYLDSPFVELRDHVRFMWDALDEWFEEAELVYTHPRDPYTRVDILSSSRHVRIEIDGVTVAESHQPTMLFETRLPPRFYLPLTDVRVDLLRPSTTETHCPYKGMATYWSIDIGGKIYPDYVWIYRSPFPESQKIAGLVAFYNEKVDIYLDGELQVRPHTHFS